MSGFDQKLGNNFQKADFSSNLFSEWDILIHSPLIKVIHLKFWPLHLRTSIIMTSWHPSKTAKEVELFFDAVHNFQGLHEFSYKYNKGN